MVTTGLRRDFLLQKGRHSAGPPPLCFRRRFRSAAGEPRHACYATFHGAMEYAGGVLQICWQIECHTHRIHGAAIYGNIYH